MVQPSARGLQDAGEFDHARGRGVVRHRVVEPRRRGPGGGVSARVQRERHLLRADVCGDVRHPVVRATRCLASATHVAAAGVAVGPADDCAVHRALGVPDHQGRERVDVRPQDHDDDSGDEPGGHRDSILGASAVGEVCGKRALCLRRADIFGSTVCLAVPRACMRQPKPSENRPTPRRLR